MSIYDRDYLKTDAGGHPLALVTRTAVGLLLFLNVVAWILQLLVDEKLTDLMVAGRDQVFGFQLWRLVTANFAHSTDKVWHIVANMLILFFCGPEVERLYGRRNFYFLYLTAGILAIGAHVVFSPAPVYGASGAVLAILVVYAMHYPRRTVLLFFFLPMPIWLLCVLVVGFDVLGLLSGGTGQGPQVAHLAHLAGAGFGLAFCKFDLRWERIRGLGGAGARRPRRAPGRKVEGKILSFPKGKSPRTEKPVEADPVSDRIDTLLAKISAEGKDSLTAEELGFLKDNSSRYRSR